MSAPQRRLVARTRLLPTRRVGAPDVLRPLPGRDSFAWLRHGRGFVTTGVTARLPVGPGRDRFARAASDLAALFEGAEIEDAVGAPGTGLLAAGAMAFDAGATSALIVPSRVTGQDREGRAWTTDISWSAPDPDPRGRAIGALATVGAGTGGSGGKAPSAIHGRPAGYEERQRWKAAVCAVLDAIASNEVSKVVLARQVVVEPHSLLDGPLLLARLAATHPSCFAFSVDGLIGASPELLVRRTGATVVSRPLAGTVGRGATAGTDHRLLAELTSSPKLSWEHRLVVDAVAAALAPRCSTLSVPSSPSVVRLATVAHLATRVEGRLRGEGPSALGMLQGLHPTPAVGGTPTEAALGLISALEGFDRGRYAGPVGWVDSRGDGEWALALRCAELSGATARLVAGAGIVEGSDPDAEWDETEAKLDAVLGCVEAPRPTHL